MLQALIMFVGKNCTGNASYPTYLSTALALGNLKSME